MCRGNRLLTNADSLALPLLSFPRVLERLSSLSLSHLVSDTVPFCRGVSWTGAARCWRREQIPRSPSKEARGGGGKYRQFSVSAPAVAATVLVFYPDSLCSSRSLASGGSSLPPHVCLCVLESAKCVHTWPPIRLPADTLPQSSAEKRERKGGCRLMLATRRVVPRSRFLAPPLKLTDRQEDRR